jgi:hypothetical protein
VSVALSELRCGRIVWALVRNHRGYRKTRPAIIVTADKEISDAEPLMPNRWC